MSNRRHLHLCRVDGVKFMMERDDLKGEKQHGKAVDKKVTYFENFQQMHVKR